ncbi:hypothetical protein EDC14_105816 [Hydrogenispora ethanolica]|uniref:Uncharacterized protein n=1 Tax=Hydrogenispora ethanolica TaxID=1082276 RepID=A0A4R1QQ08_HYDET|nr:hypothetical protein [Hydrogenispora ethanolica]TCL54963.1 hypothetical protein EDC14_105816 [Hydrogenispora ethanolica]
METVLKVLEKLLKVLIDLVALATGVLALYGTWKDFSGSKKRKTAPQRLSSKSRKSRGS